MSTSRFSTVFIAVALLSLTARVEAVLVAADSFLQGPAAGRPLGQYATGDIRASGTTLQGFASPGQYAGNTGNFQIEATVGARQDAAQVAYDTAVTAGGLQRQVNWLGATDTTLRSVTRELSTTPTSNVWWMSVMLSRATGSWGTVGNANINTYSSAVVAGFANGADSNNGVAFGFSNGTGDGLPNLVMRSNYQTLTTLATDVPANTLQFVIAKIDLNLAGLDTIRVWVNPSSADSESALGTPVVTVTNHSVNVDGSLAALTPFTRTRMVSLGAAGSAKIDELRLATTLSGLTGIAAIPEAGSFLTFGLLASFMAIKGRSRRA